jgi:Leucine-rich repeat (LRR) protein
MTNLVTLNMAENQLSGRIPLVWAKLQKLEKIWLGNNNLTGSVPNHFFNSWSQLKVLDLSHNRFTGTLPKTFPTRAKRLQILYLEDNNFSGSLPELFQVPVTTDTANTGTVISEDGNKNKTITSATSYVALAELQVMDLGNNKMIGTIPISWLSLPLLRDWNLAGNHFTGTLPTEIFQLSNLEALVLV